MKITKEGLSLTEVMISIALVAVALLGLIRLGSVAVRTSDAGRSMAIANQLNDEVLEAARSIRDRENSASPIACSNGITTVVVFECDGAYTYNATSDQFEYTGVILDPVTPPALAITPTFGQVDSVNYPTFYRQILFEPDTGAYSGQKTTVTARTYYFENNRWPGVTSTTILTKWR